MGKNKQKRKEEAEILAAIQDLTSLPENSICADCSEPAPRWASVNIGCFLCIRCAGLHRNLGSHISVVKSTTLDNWTPEYIRTMAEWGNKRSNARYLSGKNAPPAPRTSDSEMEKYIRNKYDKKLFMTGGSGAPTPASSSSASSSSAKTVVKPGDTEKYSQQLRSLAQMGFGNVDKSIVALKKAGGSLDGAVEILVSAGSVSPPKIDSPKAIRAVAIRAAQSESIQLSPGGGDVSDAKKAELAEKLKSALDTLNVMGFSDNDANKAALKQANGKIDQAANILIDARQKRGGQPDASLAQASAMLGKPPASKQRQATGPHNYAPVKQQSSNISLGLNQMSISEPATAATSTANGSSAASDPFSSFFEPGSNSVATTPQQSQQDPRLLQLQQQNLLLQQQLQAQQQQQQLIQVQLNNQAQLQQQQLQLNCAVMKHPFQSSSPTQTGFAVGAPLQTQQSSQLMQSNPFNAAAQQLPQQLQQNTPFGSIFGQQAPTAQPTQQPDQLYQRQNTQQPQNNSFGNSVQAQTRPASDPFGLSMAALQPQNTLSRAQQQQQPQQPQQPQQQQQQHIRKDPAPFDPFSNMLGQSSMLVSQPAAAPVLPSQPQSLQQIQPQQQFQHAQGAVSPTSGSAKDSIMAMYNAPTPLQQQQQLMMQNALAGGQVFVVMQPAPGALAGIRPLQPQSGGGMGGGSSYSTHSANQGFGQQTVPRQQSSGGFGSVPTGPFSSIQGMGMGMPPSNQQQQQQLTGGKGNPFF